MALLKIVIDKSARSLLDYISRAQATGGGPPIHTNMAGRTPREMAKEVGVFRALRPNLKKAIGHLMISVSPEDESRMTDEAWRRAVDIALEAHGVADAPFSAWVHHDSDHRHCHIFFSRIRADGSVISDSHSYRKNETAAREMERQLGLKPPGALPPESKPGNRRALENAARRAERRNEKMDYALIKKEIDAALLAGASTPDQLADALGSAGYRAEFTRRGVGEDGEDGEIAGWRIADAVVSADGAPPTAVKASSVHRELAWGRVAERLAANRPGQAAAQGERAHTLADAARITLAALDADETDIDRLTQRLRAAGVAIHHRREPPEDGQISGWSWEVAGERAAASSLDPRLGWGQVQMTLRDAQQRAGLAPPPLGGRPQRGHGLGPADRQAGEASLARRLRAFGFQTVECEQAALWTNRRGDQLRLLVDRVELHPAAPRAGAARWDDRAVSAWVLAAKLTQGDRLSLVTAGDLDPHLRRLLVEACAVENVTIVELADEIARERERRRAAEAAAEAPALGLRAAPQPATEAAQILAGTLRELEVESLALPTSAALRQRAAELRERARALVSRHIMNVGGDHAAAVARARARAFDAALAEAQRGWDAQALPGQPHFADAQKSLAEAEAAWTSARSAPEPSLLTDPLGRAAKTRQAAIDAAARRVEDERRKLKSLTGARILDLPARRAIFDQRMWVIAAERDPEIFEHEMVEAIAARVAAAAQGAEQREVQAGEAAEGEAARQRLREQERDAPSPAGEQDDDQQDDDDQRHDRPRGG